LQCPFVDTPEVERISKFIGDQKGFSTSYELPEYVDPKEAGKMVLIDLLTLAIVMNYLPKQHD
jgi:S-DNA-T family DNA segregation ATPase FtsK/SpoIIIE